MQNLTENRKEAILKMLEEAIVDLKQARKRIHDIVEKVLEMKEAGDSIADQVIVAIAALTIDDLNALTDPEGQAA